MAPEKLIEKTHNFLNLDKRKQKQKKDKISHLLKKLKRQKKVLEKRLEEEKRPDEIKRIKRHLKVIHAQRKKGVALCKELGCKK